MPQLAEIRDSVWAGLEEEAAARDTTVSGLINKILREWLEKNTETVDEGDEEEAEGEPGSES